MNAPDKEEIEELLNCHPIYDWDNRELIKVYDQLKNLYEHWYRKELK